ncbi:hypothetical protein ACR0ST_04430 [Aliidiomarina sp. Khilg15.8]
MIITLAPQETENNDAPPAVNGQSISYRGETYDLSQLPNGGEVEAGEPFVSKIKRDNAGVVHLTLQYNYSTDTAEPMQSTNPGDYIFHVTDGQCPCPIQRKHEPVQEEVE